MTRPPLSPGAALWERRWRAVVERAERVGLDAFLVIHGDRVDQGATPTGFEYWVRTRANYGGEALLEGKAERIATVVERIDVVLTEWEAKRRQTVMRNPILALPAAVKLQRLDPGTKAVLRELLMEMRADAQRQADRSWRKHKAPMAVYWKAVAVYAGHIARALR